MDFIERIFHISPDGGNGTLEIAILIAVLLPGIVAAAWRCRFPRYPRVPESQVTDRS